jgi:hypothetical protein
MVKLATNFFILNEILFGDVVKGVDIEISASLQGLPIFNLFLGNDIFILFNLLFSKLYLFLPSKWTIKLLIILCEIKTPVI